MQRLALMGGPATFNKKYRELWDRPRDIEKKLVLSLLDNDELSGSGFGISEEFEKAFAAMIDCRYCLAFSHGTAALMAGYYALEVGPGDEVITPAVGYISSYAGAMHLGARPSFADIGEDDLLISPTEIRKKITPKTRAINIIHLDGRICNLEEILKISEENNIPLLEDASHAHGARFKSKRIGNNDHITCFSLQGVNPAGKPVAAGEGGVACTNSLHYYQRMLAYCHLHRKGIKAELEGSDLSVLDEEVLGLKWRAHPLALALGLISLSTLEERNKKRADSYHKTEQALREFGFIRLPKVNSGCEMAGFFGGMKIVYEKQKLFGIPPVLFIRAMQKEGVPLKGPRIGYCEYQRKIFSSGFDLFSRRRGPILDAWCGLEKYQAINPDDYPVAQHMEKIAMTLPTFVEVEEDYYKFLKEAFEKVRDNAADLVGLSHKNRFL